MADSGSRTRQRQSAYDIPPPPTDKEPLKTNVYHFIQTSVTAARATLSVL
jgi:hypothetical protein